MLIRQRNATSYSDYLPYGCLSAELFSMVYNIRLYVATSSIESLCLMLKAKGETCKQFFSDVQGHRQPVERSPVETGHHREGRSWREYT